MLLCDCGFDFVKARIEKQQVVSYALIPDKNYQASIRREYAIIAEKNAETKYRLIARASSFVGSLTQCPRCGSWFLNEPKRGTSSVILRKAKEAAIKTVPRPGAGRTAHTTRRTSSAAGSRR